jgi:hypothetical protein
LAQTLEELEADRAIVAAARLKFLKGEMVKEVMRAGRKLVMHTASIEHFDAALAALDRDIAALTGTTGRRRRALTLSYG